MLPNKSMHKLHASYDGPIRRTMCVNNAYCIVFLNGIFSMSNLSFVSCINFTLYGISILIP